MFFFRHLTLEKSLPDDNIYLMLDLLHHKSNPHIKTVVDGSILKVFKTLT